MTVKRHPKAAVDQGSQFKPRDYHLKSITTNNAGPGRVYMYLDIV